MDAIEQAEIIYPLLVNLVNTANRRKDYLTYGEVNAALGYSQNASGHAIRSGMELIVLYCTESGHPQITSLIVNKDTNEPAEKYAFGEGEDISLEHQKCFDHAWEESFDYADIWDRRVMLREQYDI